MMLALVHSLCGDPKNLNLDAILENYKLWKESNPEEPITLI